MPDPAAIDLIRRIAARRLTVAIDATGRTSLEPVRGGVDGAVATLLGILHEAQLSGDWSRMKGCRQCEYAFFDRSKNRSAAWCAMSICGNRTKNRAYYRRRDRMSQPRPPRLGSTALKAPRGLAIAALALAASAVFVGAGASRWRTWSSRRPT